ncbi:protein sprint [Anabrus simplex]|uniref:protein sprint n=1 Tax=Anabrus simplex TaxID=316456 RepID=UPI0035A2B32A
MICGEDPKDTNKMLITQYTALLLQTSSRKTAATIVSPSYLGGDAFLEPYMQGLAPEFGSPHDKTPEDRSVASSPANTEDVPSNGGSQHQNASNTLADLAQFRLLELDGSGDSLDQDQDSSLSSSAGSSSDVGDSPCDIGLVERLIRSHPVWFLPGIQRAGAFHLLQGKEEGNFVVRQSSQPDTMAISVRLPAGKGPYIEHYLIQASDGQLSLESSDNRFDNIPSLIAHYSQCCDELPVQLSLPRALREARNRQQLSSLALLGQEFWRYPMANPRPPERVQQQQQQAEPAGLAQRTIVEGQQSPPSSGSSLSSFGSGNNNHSNNLVSRTPTSELDSDAIVLNLAPLSSSTHSQPPSLLSTFKGSCDFLATPSPPTSSPGAAGVTVTTTSTTTTIVARGPRPTPPNTLNLVCSATAQATGVIPAGARSAANSPAQVVSPQGSGMTTVESSSSICSARTGPPALPGAGKTPPPPPPRWAKPTSLSSSSSGQNFTVTTTVTFSVNNSTPPPHVEVSCVQVTPKRPQLELEGLQTLSSHAGSTTEQRPGSGPRLHQVMSPTGAGPTSTPPSDPKQPVQGRVKKHRPSHTRQTSVKESHHYRESDILDSPTVYYRSSVADKVSDYEDIWGPEVLSTFKPVAARSSPFSSPEDISSSSGGNKRTPDLLERVGTPVSASCMSLNSVNAGQKESHRNRLGLIIPPPPSSGNGSNANSPAEENQPLSTPKQGSPFYAEPADALRQAALVPRRRPKPPQQLFPAGPRSHRHSDPTLLQQWPVMSYHGGCGLERIDSSDELPPVTAALSSSVDNLSVLRSSAARNGLPPGPQGHNRPRGKPVQPPRVRPAHGHGKSFNDTSWAVDSSWEFIGNDDELCEDDEEEGEERERRFPSLEQQENQLEDGDVSSPGGKITVHELIAQRLPSLRLSPEMMSPNSNAGRTTSPLDGQLLAGISSRISSYDNVEGRASSNPDSSSLHRNGASHGASDNEDTQTIFSEPWDSSRWENLLHMGNNDSATSSVVQVAGAQPLLGPEEDDTVCEPRTPQQVNNLPPNGPYVNRSKSFKERLDPLLSPPRLQALRNRDLSGTGASIRAYALHLAADSSTTFAQNIDNFISCTRESREVNPQVVMRNMRQFMSGMKNYLVKHGEREFEKEVEKERVKLKANEFLNLDAILEAVMHKLVVRPLKEHLYQLFVDEYTRSGAIELLADNIRYARTKPLHELGLRSKIATPSEQSLETICRYLQRLQEVDSPLEKLENLLACISAIFNSVKLANQGRCITLGADDFLPLFVWVLVQSGMVAAEIEAEYMWGLLHPSLLSGEGGYYLTTLSSAVHVLKNFRACSEEQSKTLGPGASLDWRVGSLAEFRSVLKIVVPDEMHGSIITKTLPVRPNMTTRDVCKIIAHKVRITNPQDYGLFKLVDGEETLLGDGECPQDVKCAVTQVGKHCMFAYKRIDAKIAWPRTSSPQ